MNRYTDSQRTGSGAGSSSDPRGTGDSKRGSNSTINTDVAAAIVAQVAHTMEHRSEKTRNDVYKNLRQVAPAFHSQVPLKTDPTLGDFTEFVTRFSRGQNLPVASSVDTIHMPDTQTGCSPEVLNLRQLLATAPNLSTMEVPVTFGGPMAATCYGVLSDKGASKPILTVDCSWLVQNTDQLTGPPPMSVLPFPYKDDLNVRVARPIEIIFEGDQAKNLSESLRSLNESKQPVSVASRIIAACRSPAADPEDVLDVMRQLIKTQDQHRSVRLTELSLRLHGPSVDEYDKLSHVYNQAERNGHQVDKCTFSPSALHRPAPTLKEIARHRTLISSLRAPLSVFVCRTSGYEVENRLSTCGINKEPFMYREVCFDIGRSLKRPSIASVGEDLSRQPRSQFTFTRDGDPSELEVFS